MESHDTRERFDAAYTANDNASNQTIASNDRHQPVYHTMYRINLTTFTLLLALTVGSLMSEPLHPSDGAIKDLYDYLLQREYAAPVSYADHQIKRKAVRSPSLRLRFGRRSDPSVPLRPEVITIVLTNGHLVSLFSIFSTSTGIPVHTQEDELIDQKAIRAPQLRLRFGRNDPLWTSFNENALLEENFEKRAPSQRLRWGRSNLFGNLVNQFQPDDVMQQKAIRAPQLRLRFGRTDPSWAMYNEHQLAPGQQSQLVNDASEKRAPTQRLRWGRSDPALSKDSTEDKTLEPEESEGNNVDDK
uniref:Short neuropeptide F n=1 Tax=Anopheles culicifacies TaxID=139723 RepID=A0A182LRF5_9DIPT